MPDRERYPHFGIDIEHLPEAKKWEIGNKYKITLEVKMTGLSINERNEGESGYADFDVRGIEAGKIEKEYKRKLLQKGM